MKKVVHRSDTRGRSVYDWLDSHHSFSFDEYYNPERVHFGALRVLNDDRVAPGEGFQTHPHKYGNRLHTFKGSSGTWRQ